MGSKTLETAVAECLKAVSRIGKWEKVQEQVCKDGTPLGYAYEQGWNACLDEVRARLEQVRRNVEVERRG